MALTEKVTFLLGVNSKGVAKEFDKVGRAADRSLGRAEERSEKLSATFTKVGAGMAAAGALAGAALYGMAQDASSMAETVDKAAILFGEGTDQIVKFSEDAASSLGLAKDQALDAASTFAVYGKRAGLAGTDLADFSAELVTAAADMASFNEVPLEDTINAIGSALRGESEPLQRFGVDTRVAALEASALEAGMIGAGDALTDAEKPLAVVAAITGQAADQMDNFALTQDSAANQAKIAASEFQNMRLELGEAALPVLQEVVSALATMAGAFNNLPGPLKSVITQTAVWGSGLLLVGGGVLTLVGRMKEINTALSTLTTKLNVSKGALAGWGAAATAAFLAWNAWDNKQKEIEAGIDNMATAMDTSATAVDGLTMHLEGLLATNDDFRKAAENIGGDILPRMAAALLEGGAAADAMYEELAGGGFDQAKLPMFFLNLAEDVGKAKEQMEETRAVMSGMAGESQRASEEVRMLGNYATQAGDATEEDLTPPIQSATLAAKDLDEVLSDLTSALGDYFGSIQSGEEAEAAFQEALDGVGQSIEANGDALGTDTEAQRANLAARGDVIAAINGVVDSMTEENASKRDIVARTREMIQAYEDALLASNVSEDAAREYAGALDDIPSEVRTRLEQEGYDESYRQAAYLRDLYNSIPRNVTTVMSVVSLSGTPGYGQQASDDDDEERSLRSGRRLDRGRARPQFDRGDGGGSGRSLDGGGGGSQPIQLVMRDGRVLADVIVEESERRGGIPLLVRPGR